MSLIQPCLNLKSTPWLLSCENQLIVIWLKWIWVVYLSLETERIPTNTAAPVDISGPAIRKWRNRVRLPSMLVLYQGGSHEASKWSSGINYEWMKTSLCSRFSANTKSMWSNWKLLTQPLSLFHPPGVGQAHITKDIASLTTIFITIFILVIFNSSKLSCTALALKLFSTKNTFYFFSVWKTLLTKIIADLFLLYGIIQYIKGNPSEMFIISTELIQFLLWMAVLHIML